MERLPSLTGLRGIAAVAVMLFHFDFVFTPQAGISEYLPISRAYLSVDLFFMLSGFVMAHVYGETMAAGDGIWRFARARFARIYPLFIVTLLATIIVHVGLNVGSRYVAFTAGSLALNPLLLQFMHYGLNWNYPSWSISTEAMAYIAFVPGAAVLLKWKRPWIFAAICLAVLLALCILKDGKIDSGSLLPGLGRTLAGFGLGVLMWRAWKFDRAMTTKFAAWLLVLLVALEVVADFDFSTVTALGCVMILTLEDRGFIGAFLNSKPIEALGNWSYSIYLWHAPVHFAVSGTFREFGMPVRELARDDAQILALITALAVVGISAFSYRFIEVPARRFLTCGNQGQARAS